MSETYVRVLRKVVLLVADCDRHCAYSAVSRRRLELHARKPLKSTSREPGCKARLVRGGDGCRSTAAGARQQLCMGNSYTASMASIPILHFGLPKTLLSSRCRRPLFFLLGKLQKFQRFLRQVRSHHAGQLMAAALGWFLDASSIELAFL